MKNIYKKIIIMFVMALGIMGIGSISNGYVANAATVGQALTLPESGWTRYDDTNINISYTNMISWNNGNTTDFYKGGVHKSWDGIQVHPSNNAEVKFNFNGTGIRFLSQIYNKPAGDDTRNVDVEVYLDGKYYGNTNVPGKICNGIALQYEIVGLTNKEHSIVLKNNGKSNLWIDAIDISGNGILTPYSEVNTLIEMDNILNLKEGTSKDLTATTTPSSVNVVWSSSDATIATVDQAGKVTGIKEGTCTVTATIEGTDIKAECVVTVTKEEPPVEPDEPTDPDQEYIINTAYAKGENTNNASGQVTIIFKGNAEAQLKVVKTADVDSVYVGDNFTYTIEVTNTSEKVAKSVVIKDSAPNHIQFIPSEVTTTQGTVDSSSTGNNIIVNVGDIPPLGKVTIKIPVVVVE